MEDQVGDDSPAPFVESLAERYLIFSLLLGKIAGCLAYPANRLTTTCATTDVLLAMVGASQGERTSVRKVSLGNMASHEMTLSANQRLAIGCLTEMSRALSWGEAALCEQHVRLGRLQLLTPGIHKFGIGAVAMVTRVGTS